MILVQVLGEMWVAAADMNLTKLGDVGRVVLAAPTVHMSGLYRCSVASRTQQAEAEASMLVYSPVDEMEFVQRTLPGHVNVSCKVRRMTTLCAVWRHDQPLLQVTGVYPLPDVRLTLGEYSLGQEDTRVTLAPASYTVTVTAAVQRATLRPGAR